MPAGFAPEDVIRPTSAGEVASVLEEARNAGRTVVPAGGGGGTAPLPPEEPYLLLSLNGLSGMEEYEPGDLTFTARAGTTLGELDAELQPHGQWLPVDPPGAGGRTLGGVVATGLGGALQAGYGAVRDHVLGVSVVTGDGRLLRLGGRVMKNVAGFDLVRLMVGSRGALAVLVSVSMRVSPRPRGERVLVLDGVDSDALLDAARAVATATVVPASAVLTRIGARSEEALLVRLHGARVDLDSDRRTLEAAAGMNFREVEGGGESAVERVRDLASGGALAFRQASLPAELPERWRAFRTALPQAQLHADVLSGRLRGAVSDQPSADQVARVREVAEATGRPVLFSALSPDLHPAVRPWDGAGADADAGLTGRLEARFDPHGTLTPGRFGR